MEQDSKTPGNEVMSTRHVVIFDSILGAIGGAFGGAGVALHACVTDPVIHCSRKTYARRLRVAMAHHRKLVLRATHPRGWELVGRCTLAGITMCGTAALVRETRGEKDFWNLVVASVPAAGILHAGYGLQGAAKGALRILVMNAILYPTLAFAMEKLAEDGTEVTEQSAS